MGLLYAKNGKLYCNEYMEIYIPINFDMVNKGISLETLGCVYLRGFPDGNEGPIQFLNVPVTVNFMIYNTKNETIRVHDRSIEVLTLQYMKDSYVLHQTIPNGREIAEEFLVSLLSGKLPKTLNYTKIIDLWWSNLEISGVDFKVPSKIMEMVISALYRDPHNNKNRYGQLYGTQSNPTGYDYDTNNVRAIVRSLSTFSGLVFEDISTMISSGIVNTADEIEEPESPLEKIIHY